MNLLTRWMMVQIFLTSAAFAQTPDWSVTSAPARFVVEPDAAGAVPLTSITLGLPKTEWATMPIRVFTDGGVAVGSELLWQAPGEPTTLLFDSSSGAKRYSIFMGSNLPAMHLPGVKSGVMLESRAGDGKPVNSLPEMLQAWDKSTTVFGRALVPGMFEGGHRFGPQGNLLERFQGWFDLGKAATLQLATISNDASFVLVDGKEVVEWPGAHDFRPGRKGEHQGSVDLAPGPHLLEYYNAYIAGDSNHSLLNSLAVKGGPLNQWTMLRPETPFFLPSGRAHVRDYQIQSNGAGGPAPALAMDWAMVDQSVLAPEIPDLGLISVRLACQPTRGTATWTFDDGSTAQGATVQHLFLRPGMRTVQLSVKDGTADVGSLQQVISVHPNWTQLTSNPPRLVPAHQADVIARDAQALSPTDLASCMAVFEIFKSSDGLVKIIPAVCAKLKAISDADLAYVEAAGLYLAREDPAHAADATQLLSALIDRCSQPGASPALTAMGQQSRLVLARSTLTNTEQTADVKTWLDGVDRHALTGDDPRVLDILRADLALAMGDPAAARQQYEALTGSPTGTDARSSIWRTAKIAQARAFLDTTDPDSAADALNDVAWRAPIEKLSPEWALTWMRLLEDQNRPAAAYLWGKRVLPAITESGRSELLYRLTELGFVQGDNDRARNNLAELLKKFPYSPEAAKAKEKWPDAK